MQKVTLYKYIRPDGGTTVSPVEPMDVEYITAFRLIADEGKMLTLDGDNLIYCVDVDNDEGWYEVNEPDWLKNPDDQFVPSFVDPDEWTSAGADDATEDDYIDALVEIGVDVSEEI